MSDFSEANKKVHKVEDQWHYPILTKYGFTPITKEQAGFVRRYEYQRGEHKIVCNTGVNADYWSNPSGCGGGYWSELEPHVKNLNYICSECNSEFVPSYGEYKRCQSCLTDQHSNAEHTLKVE